MNLKQKLADTKTKIKENRLAIIATVSTGVAVGVSVAYAINESNHKKFLTDMVEKLKVIRDLELERSTTERLYISEETKQEIRDGSQDVWFNVDGNRFDVLMHPTED